jgi:hypothetical protein
MWQNRELSFYGVTGNLSEAKVTFSQGKIVECRKIETCPNRLNFDAVSPAVVSLQSRHYGGWSDSIPVMKLP